MKTVKVNVGTGYNVQIGQGAFATCADTVKNISQGAKTAVITDSNVAPLYLDKVMNTLEKAGVDAVSLVVGAGEQNKNMSTLSDILEFMAVEGLTRKSCAVALGGGVVGDMTGFAAGCYMRGIKYIGMPTTLLAAVDSSVGGKTAVDLKKGKNLAGLFIQPSAVICDTDCLSTLGKNTFADGAAEAIKTGVLGDEKLFCIFENGTADKNISEVIERCVLYKGSIVEKDEKEGGLRKLLNFGHTIGHAAELLSNYSLSHGHAVAIGMALIAGYSYKKGICDKECFDRIVNTLKANALPVNTDYSSSKLANAAVSDKKRSGNTVTLILPKKIGECVMCETDISQLCSVIDLGKEALL